MAELSQITLPSGTTYDFKDTVARNIAAGGIQLKGETTTPLTDGSTTNPIILNGESYTAVNQDAVFYDHKELVFDGTRWHEFGDMSGVGSLAYKDTASGTYTPAGSVSKPNVSVTPQTATIKEIDDGGSVTPGTSSTPTAVTLPELSVTVSNETLVLSWSAGSVTPGTGGTPTQVTLPTTKQTSVMTGVSAELDAAPAFTGTSGTVEVS